MDPEHLPDISFIFCCGFWLVWWLVLLFTTESGSFNKLSSILNHRQGSGLADLSSAAWIVPSSESWELGKWCFRWSSMKRSTLITEVHGTRCTLSYAWCCQHPYSGTNRSVSRHLVITSWMLRLKLSLLGSNKETNSSGCSSLGFSLLTAYWQSPATKGLAASLPTSLNWCALAPSKALKSSLIVYPAWFWEAFTGIAVMLGVMLIRVGWVGRGGGGGWKQQGSSK